MGAVALAQPGGRGAWRDAADPGELDHQGAVRRTAAGPARHRLAAGYKLLDDVLDDYVEQDRGSAELVADGFAPELVERVLRMVDIAEYKRRQYPPGPKISVKGFGRDRRLPITNRWREVAPGTQADPDPDAPASPRHPLPPE